MTSENKKIILLTLISLSLSLSISSCYPKKTTPQKQGEEQKETFTKKPSKDVVTDSDGDVEFEKQIKKQYREAYAFFINKEYKKAAEAFEEIEKNYPYSAVARRSLLHATYSQFKLKKYDETIALADKYINIYPTDKNIDYITFIKGEAYFAQIKNIKRDITPALKAKEIYESVQNNFPKSEYNSPIEKRLLFVNDQLAYKEISIGHYYQKRQLAQAALNRYNKVVLNYPNSRHLPEALFRMVEIYLKLGVYNEAKSLGITLGANYKNTIWYKNAYELLNKHRPKTKKNKV